MEGIEGRHKILCPEDTVGFQAGLGLQDWEVPVNWVRVWVEGLGFGVRGLR